jgi:zinc transport system substrate-binding protein
MGATVMSAPVNLLIAAGVVLPLLLISCDGSGAPARAPDLPVVAVTVQPLAGVVDRLLPTGVAELRVLVPPGASPHSFEPGMRQLAVIQGAALIFEVGHPAFSWESNWLDGLLAGTDTDRVLLSEGCAWIEDDPHVWLDPDCLDRLAESAAAALSASFPQHASEIRERLSELRREIMAEDASIRSALADRKGRTFLVQHGAWGYFARAYGLVQLAILSHESSGAGAARLAMVIDSARAADIREVFVQPQLSTEASRMVAEEIGAGIRPLDPLGRDPLQTLRETAVAVLEATSP